MEVLVVISGLPKNNGIQHETIRISNNKQYNTSFVFARPKYNWNIPLLVKATFYLCTSPNQICKGYVSKGIQCYKVVLHCVCD